MLITTELGKLLETPVCTFTRCIVLQVIRYMEDKLRQRDAMTEKLRLKNTTLKGQLQKVRDRLLCPAKRACCLGSLARGLVVIRRMATELLRVQNICAYGEAPRANTKRGCKTMTFFLSRCVYLYLEVVSMKYPPV